MPSDDPRVSSCVGLVLDGKQVNGDGRVVIELYLIVNLSDNYTESRQGSLPLCLIIHRPKLLRILICFVINFLLFSAINYHPSVVSIFNSSVLA